MRKAWQPTEADEEEHQKHLSHLSQAEQEVLRERLLQAWRQKISFELASWKSNSYSTSAKALRDQFDPDTGWFWKSSERESR